MVVYPILIDGELVTATTVVQLLWLDLVTMAGLEKVGGNLFQSIAEFRCSSYGKHKTAGQTGAGVILSGSLEMSNVDLSEEFTDMIMAQRGFQANTRIITTSDEILQELVNLKR